MAENDGWSVRAIVQQGAQGYIFTVVSGVAMAVLAGALGSVAPFTDKWTDGQRLSFVIGLILVAFVVGVLLAGLAQSLIPALKSSGRPEAAIRDLEPSTLSPAERTDAEIETTIREWLLRNKWQITPIPMSGPSTAFEFFVEMQLAPGRGDRKPVKVSKTLSWPMLIIELGVSTGTRRDAVKAMGNVGRTLMNTDVGVHLAMLGVGHELVESTEHDSVVVTIHHAVPIAIAETENGFMDTIDRIKCAGDVVALLFRQHITMAMAAQAAAQSGQNTASPPQTEEP